MSGEKIGKAVLGDCMINVIGRWTTRSAWSEMI